MNDSAPDAGWPAVPIGPHRDVLVQVGKAAERRAAGAWKRRVLCPVVFGPGIAGPAGRAEKRPGQPGRGADEPRPRKWPQRRVAGTGLGLQIDLLVATGPGRAGGTRVRDSGRSSSPGLLGTPADAWVTSCVVRR
jgi:hypothetical protein